MVGNVDADRSAQHKTYSADEVPNTLLVPANIQSGMGRRLDQAGYWSIESAVENDLDTVVPSCRTMITHTKITIASITAYSTAVGPDSSFQNVPTALRTAFMAHSRFDLGREPHLTNALGWCKKNMLWVQ